MNRNKQKAQSLLEYSTLLGIIVVILMAMQPLIKRSTQGMIKIVADQIGIQKNSDQPFDYSSYLQNAYVVTRATLYEGKSEYNEVTNYYYDDRSVTQSTEIMNLGISQ